MHASTRSDATVRIFRESERAGQPRVHMECTRRMHSDRSSGLARCMHSSSRCIVPSEPEYSWHSANYSRRQLQRCSFMKFQQLFVREFMRARHSPRSRHEPGKR